jgi:glutamate racemase
VWQVACPEFVPLIEENRIYDPYTQQVAQDYLQPLLAAQIDTLVFGCTHYQHLKPVFREILPASIHLVDPASSVVKAARKELEVLGLSNNQMSVATHFTVSGCPQSFAALSQQWLGFCPKVEQIYLPTVATPPVSLEMLD